MCFREPASSFYCVMNGFVGRSRRRRRGSVVREISDDEGRYEARPRKGRICFPFGGEIERGREQMKRGRGRERGREGCACKEEWDGKVIMRRKAGLGVGGGGGGGSVRIRCARCCVRCVSMIRLFRNKKTMNPESVGRRTKKRLSILFSPRRIKITSQTIGTRKREEPV